MDKGLAIKHHFAPDDAPCIIKADGKIEWFDKEYTDEEIEQWKAERLADLNSIAWIGNRKAEYIKEGCTKEALIVALWEKVVENRPEAAVALEIKRQAVKIKIPKP